MRRGKGVGEGRRVFSFSRGPGRLLLRLSETSSSAETSPSRTIEARRRGGRTRKEGREREARREREKERRQSTFSFPGGRTANWLGPSQNRNLRLIHNFPSAFSVQPDQPARPTLAPSPLLDTGQTGQAPKQQHIYPLPVCIYFLLPFSSITPACCNACDNNFATEGENFSTSLMRSFGSPGIARAPCRSLSSTCLPWLISLYSTS